MFSRSSPRAGGVVAEVLAGVLLGQEVGVDEIVALFAARGPEVAAVADVADDLRREAVGEVVTWVANRNINYTNICTFKCRFCGFSKGPLSLNLRGDPYLLGLDEIQRRVVEAVECGATEVCLQGGIHPSFDGDYYIDVCRAVKDVAPSIHVHGFTALEVTEGARRLREPLAVYLQRLVDVGLKSLPGTAAEILDDEVRAELCPDKIDTEEWLDAHRTAHNIGLSSNITIMFGSIERSVHWARHLVRTRDPAKGDRRLHRVRASAVRAHGRPDLPAAQGASRTHLPRNVARCTRWRASPTAVGSEHPGVVGEGRSRRSSPGALGGSQRSRGTLMDENISRAAGASHGQRMDEDAFRAIVDPLDRPLEQRTTLYGRVETVA